MRQSISPALYCDPTGYQVVFRPHTAAKGFETCLSTRPGTAANVRWPGRPLAVFNYRLQARAMATMMSPNVIMYSPVECGVLMPGVASGLWGECCWNWSD